MYRGDGRTADVAINERHETTVDSDKETPTLKKHQF